jgi:hypothetical protein
MGYACVISSAWVLCELAKMVHRQGIQPDASRPQEISLMQQFIRPIVRSVWVRSFLLSLLVALFCSCAKVNDTGMRLVSTKVDGYLIVNAQLLVGTVLLVPDRTGRVSFSAEKGAISACSGSWRYTATNAGEADVRCNDGTQLSLKITLLSETRGYGYGSTAQGPSSLVFGLSEQDASAFLTVPPGKTLAIGAESGALELN